MSWSCCRREEKRVGLRERERERERGMEEF